MANVDDTVRALQEQNIIARVCARTNMEINLQNTKMMVGLRGTSRDCILMGMLESVSANKYICLFITLKLV